MNFHSSDPVRNAQMLGFAGVLPFAAGLLLLILGPTGIREIALRSLLIYAAVILSFMGAVHWGRALYLPAKSNDDARRSKDFVVSVVPALVGWAALFLAPRPGLIALAVGFVALYLYERRRLTNDTVASWYLPLRLKLTIAVVLSLVLAAFAL